MILAAHNPEFSDDCSITELLSRIAILSSQLGSANKQIVDLINQLDSADKQIVDLISQNADLTKQKTETEEQFSREKTALLQRIEKLERSAALNSNNSCKPPSSDGLRKSSGKKDKEKKSGQRVCATVQAASPAASRATRAIQSSRLTTRMRLLISCRSNARIVRLNSRLKIQPVLSADRLLTFRRLLLPSIVDILAR